MTHSMYSPIAAGSGLSSPDAADYHQRWLVIDDTGQWINDASLLAKIEVDMRFGYLVLKAPGMLRLDIPLDVIEDDDSVRGYAQVGQQQVDVVDEGEVAATWATACLGRPCRLVKVHPQATQVQWPG